MIIDILLWGLVAGAIHFVIIGALYSNPIVDKVYKDGQKNDPSVRAWPSMPKYLISMFLGTQVEVYILTAAYLWLRTFIPLEGYFEALILGGIFSGIRVYPRFWNMWIQTTYPRKMLAIEFINGIISTLAIVFAVEMFV